MIQTPPKIGNFFCGEKKVKQVEFGLRDNGHSGRRKLNKSVPAGWGSLGCSGSTWGQGFHRSGSQCRGRRLKSPQEKGNPYPEKRPVGTGIMWLPSEKERSFVPQVPYMNPKTLLTKSCGPFSQHLSPFLFNRN